MNQILFFMKTITIYIHPNISRGWSSYRNIDRHTSCTTLLDISRHKAIWRYGTSESVVFGTRQHSHAFMGVASVKVAGSVIPLADRVKPLGVTLDKRLWMDKDVNEVSRACFYHLHALQHIRPAITSEDANMIAYSVIGSRDTMHDTIRYTITI